MARRMFSDEITTSDAFLDMPTESQLLYFHLGMNADDDGFIANTKMTQRILGASDDALKILFAKKFLLAFENGVCVIKHWRINNYIRKDIYKETKYIEQKRRLYIRENGAYSMNPTNAVALPPGHFSLQDQFGKDVENEPGSNFVDEPSTERGRAGYVGKVRKGKVSVEKSSKSTRAPFVKPTVEEVAAYCKERNNGISAQNFIDFYSSKGWKVGNQPMKDWQACVRTWEQRRGATEKPKVAGKFDNVKTTKV